MRWFWIDRFVEFESGRQAKAVKTVSLSENHLHDHFPDYPIMPHSLILEGLAQTGGLLAAEVNGFEERVILAKVSNLKFHCQAIPGDTLTYHAELSEINESGAITSLTSHVGDRLQAEAQIFFVHLSDDISGVDLFDPDEYYRMVKTLRIFDVGRKQDGTPIDIPPKFACLA